MSKQPKNEVVKKEAAVIADRPVLMAPSESVASGKKFFVEKMQNQMVAMVNPEAKLANDRKRMFAAYSQCLALDDQLSPTELADKLLAAARGT